MTWFDIQIPAICGMGLHLRLDGFRLVYAVIAIFMWSVSGAFSRQYMAHYKNKRRYYIFFWATFAATLGVFLSANLYTLFIFFEIMSLTSYVWVGFDEKKESMKAAETYLAVAVIGGMVMLMGLFLLYHLTGTLEMDALAQFAQEIPTEKKGMLYAAAGCLLFGFGAKAGTFPLHIWLPKAHPVAPAPASALLSGILTKAGVFGVIFLSCVLLHGDGTWNLMIVILGLITMFLGAFLAVFSVNLKRTLACSSVSQIGFIFTGIGMSGVLAAAGEGNLLAVRGAFLHMVNHSLIKLVLFLCAGVVYMNLHKLDLNDIRGFGRNKPVLKFCFLMGALGIGGVPFWNGYVSKTLIHESIVEYCEFLHEAGGLAQNLLWNPQFWKGAEALFLFSGGLTVAYMTKLFVALFLEKHPTRQEEFDSMADTYLTPLSRSVLLTAAVVLPILGMLPGITMNRLADLGEGFFSPVGHHHEVAYFSLVNLKGAVISLVIGAVVYAGFIRIFLMKKEYLNRWPSWLDLENLVYRPMIQVLIVCSLFVCRVMDHLVDAVIVIFRKTTHRQAKEPKLHPEGQWLARAAGRIADGLSVLTGKHRTSAVPSLVKKEKRIKHLLVLVEQSFSFSLLWCCIGLFFTIGYLLFTFVWK